MRAMLRYAAFAVTASLSILVGGQRAVAQQPALPSRPASSSTDRIADYVTEASQRFGIPAAWIRAVIRIESAGEIGVTSPAGAMGLMQVMPQTYAPLRARLGLGADAYEPHDNIIAGTAYLREMHDRYGDVGFLAAYNAGPARYEESRAGGRSLPSETILYMARLGPVLGIDGGEMLAFNAQSDTMTPEEAPIFVALRGSRSAANTEAIASPPNRVASVDLPAGQQTDGLFTARRTSPSSTYPALQDVAKAPPGMPASTIQAAISEQPSAEQDDIFMHRGTIRTVR